MDKALPAQVDRFDSCANVFANSSSPTFVEIAILSDGSFDHAMQTFGQFAQADVTATSRALSLVRYEDLDALPLNDGADLGQSSNTVRESLDNYFPGEAFGPQLVDSYRGVNFDSRPGIIPLVQLDELSSIGVTLYYEETARAELRGLDGEQVKVVITNDFTQTANFGIRFFDENMNLMENVNYTSALGINYQPIVSAVPEPSSFLMLSALGILGLIPRRRAGK